MLSSTPSTQQEKFVCLFSGALYVCTEGVFPNKRLMQMVSIFSRKYSEVPDVQRKSFTDNIFIEHAADLVRLFRFFYECDYAERDVAGTALWSYVRVVLIVVVIVQDPSP